MCPKNYRRKSDSIPCELCGISQLCNAIPHLKSQNLTLNNVEIVTRKKAYSKHDILVAEGQKLDNYIIIHSGAIKSFVTINGKEHITSFSFPGDIIGLESFNDQMSKNSIAALSDVEVCLVGFDDLNVMIANNLLINELVRKWMCDKINEQQNILLAYSQKKAEAKIATFIYTIYMKFLTNLQGTTNLKLFMSRAEIANYLNLTIETVSRVISKLIDAKIIAVKGRYVTILNVNALKNYA